ncbi:Rpn family recombination-promoting nuclease/putative transposase [Myxococcota bacterium]|nr:Rpn family recombination-promoting nuclease/putative transposase [Myxococcota bacterium]
MSNTPHDHLFKLVFSEPAELAPVLRALLPAPVAERLDLDQLIPSPTEQLDGDLRLRAPDLLYRAPWLGGGWAHLALVIEHQSSPDPLMPLRALRTTLRVWEQAEGPRLPVVITVVITHGARPWSAPTRLSELYDAPPEAIERLRPYLPELGLLLEDLAVIPDERVPGDGGGKLALLLLRHAHDNKVWETLDANVPLFAEAVSVLGDSRAVGLLSYAMHVSDAPWDVALKQKLLPLLQTPEREKIMGYADRRFEEGLAVGEQRGITIGEQRGITIGEQRGITIGEQRGEQRGITIGEQRAERRLRQDLVTRLLRKRFGSALTPEHEAVLAEASVDELEVFIENVLVMSHPDELLHNRGGR